MEEKIHLKVNKWNRPGNKLLFLLPAITFVLIVLLIWKLFG